MARHKNVDWQLPTANSWENTNAALLMDIRDELQTLNRIMRCPHVQIGFRALAKIAKANDAAFKRRVEAAVRKRAKRRAGA